MGSLDSSLFDGALNWNRRHPTLTMQLTTFTLISILSASVFAKSDLCSDPRVKKNHANNCAQFIDTEAGQLSFSQIGSIGKSSNICKTLKPAVFTKLENRVQALNANKDLLDILPTRCIKDLAIHQQALFSTLFNVLDANQQKSMFKRNKMCSSKKSYDGTSAETELTDFCKEKKLKDEKEEIKKDRADIENERTKLAEEKAKNKPNSADSVAFTAACIFVPIMAAAALL